MISIPLRIPKRWIPALLVMAALFIGSSIPSLSIPPLGVDWSDKVWHALAYSVLGFWLQYAAGPFKRSRRLLFRYWLIGAMYGISDECHQYFVPGRWMDPIDALADGVGVAVGQMIFLWIKGARGRGEN